MNVHMQNATREERPILRHLMEFYVYDFSEINGTHVKDNGYFCAEAYLQKHVDCYWRHPRMHPFLVRVDGKLAGFALIIGRSYFSHDESVSDIDEFFVMRRFRRQGVGQRAAMEVFERFPGQWEVRETVENVAAHAFWRKVIGRYMGGRFEEVFYNDERWRGPVQSFNNSR